MSETILSLTDQQNNWIEAYKRSIQELKLLANGLDEDTWNQPRKPEFWSCAQSIGHLNKSNQALINALEKALAGGSTINSQNEWKPTLLERIFLKMVGENPPIPVKVPSIFVPDTHYALLPTIADFCGNHERLISYVEASKNINLSKVKVPSAAAQQLKLSAGCWFQATVIHDAYHLKQASETILLLTSKA